MWILQGIGESKEVFNLLPKREYQVGRKDCDILLANDASISRKHAVIKIESDASADKITVSDASKYGTFVNGRKVLSTISLKPQDEVLFGQCQHKFRLLHKPFIVATSCINNNEKKAMVKLLANKLGGSVVSEWKMECNYLVMEEVTFTVKTVSALAKGCPIVTPKFLEDCFKCCQQPSQPMIETKSYFPKLVEPSLKGKEELFQPNEQRQKLFDGKCFIFLSRKQFKRLSTAVKMAGGMVDLCDNQDETKVPQILSDDSLVLAPELKDENAASPEQAQWIKYIMEQLRLADVRSIKESEVGLAILNVSLETYCNPMSSTDTSIAGTTSSQLMQETFADFTSHWHPTHKEKQRDHTRPAEAIEFKKPTVLALDSQFDIDKKRKRSSETSMYITDTIPLETSIHEAKRQRKQTIENDETCTNSFKEKAQQEKSKNLQEENTNFKEKSKGFQAKSSITNNIVKDTPVKVSYNAESATKAKPPEVLPVVGIKKEEIEESELFNDEDPFVLDDEEEEDIMVVDTETSANLGRSKKHRSHETERSRVSESQFTADFEVKKSDKERSDNLGRSAKHHPSETEKSRVSESQFTEDYEVTKGNTQASANFGKKSKHQPVETEKSLVSESQFSEDFVLTRRKPIESDEVKSEPRDTYFPAEENDGFEFEEAAGLVAVDLCGFLNSKMQRPKIERDPEEDSEIQNAATVVKYAALVTRPTVKKPSTVHQNGNVKNFKKFKKAYYPGKHLSIPNIIGGRDLVVYQSEDENREHVFAEIRAVNEEEERREKYIDDLFNWNSDDTRRKRR